MYKAIFSLALAVTVASPAHAVTTIIVNSGATQLPTYTTAQVFQNFSTPNANGTQFAVNTTNNTGTTPTVESVLNGADITTRNVAASGFTDDYLSISNLARYTVTFTTPVAFFSFVFNGIVQQNRVTLNFVGGTSQAFAGDAILGSPSVLPAFGRVSYDIGTGPKIASVVFFRQGQGQSTFRFDDLAAAAPEPATWLMMILGFGLVGGQLRRRRTKVKVKFATA